MHILPVPFRWLLSLFSVCYYWAGWPCECPTWSCSQWVALNIVPLVWATECKHVNRVVNIWFRLKIWEQQQVRIGNLYYMSCVWKFTYFHLGSTIFVVIAENSVVSSPQIVCPFTFSGHSRLWSRHVPVEPLSWLDWYSLCDGYTDMSHWYKSVLQ